MTLTCLVDLPIGNPPDLGGWRQRVLSVSYNKLGNVQGAQGERAVSLKSIQAGLIIGESPATSESLNTQWHIDLSVSFWPDSGI